MKVVKVLSSLVFGLLIILAIGMYLAVRHFDLNQYKPYIADIVARETGRRLAINGDAELAISLVPTVVINDVALSNPDWATEPEMVKVKQVKVTFALMPLLKKQVVLKEILLASPEIYLQKTAQGQNNWTFGSPKVKTQKTTQQVAVEANPLVKGAALAGFAARDVLIENGLLHYQDGHKTQKIELKKVAFAIPDMNERITLEFDMAYNGQPIKGEATLGSVNAFLQSEEAFPVLLDMTAYKMKLNLNGSVIGAMSENPVYAFETNLYNPAGNMNAPETTLVARIDGDMNAAKATIATLNVANNLITGTAETRWSTKTPEIKANLRSNKFSLLSLQKSSPLAFEMPSLVSEAQAIEVPNDKIPYELLRLVNADVSVDIKKFIIDKGFEADNVRLNAKINNGVLQLNPMSLNFGGGAITGKMTVNAAQQKIDFEATGKNLQLQNLHSEFTVSGNNDFGVLEGGAVDVSLNGSTTGATYRQLLQSLNGRAIFIAGQSVMQTGGLAFLKGNLISQLLEILNIDTQKASRLDMICAVVRADIAGGKAVFPKGIAFDSKQLTVVGNGQINLMNDKLDFAIEPSMNKLASGNVTQALASFIKLGGTLQNPRLSLDNKEALKTLVGVAATGGVSYLGSQVLLNGDGAPCYTALEGTSYATRFPKPTGVKATTQNVVDDTSKQLKQGLKDLKNTAKDILKSFQMD